MRKISNAGLVNKSSGTKAFWYHGFVDRLQILLRSYAVTYILLKMERKEYAMLYQMRAYKGESAAHSMCYQDISAISAYLLIRDNNH